MEFSAQSGVAIRTTHAAAKPSGSGLRLTVSRSAEVGDPQARYASVVLRIKETTAYHWGVAMAECTTPQLALGNCKQVDHCATVWFAH